MEEMIRLFPVHLRNRISGKKIFGDDIEEIRIRADRPVLLCTASGERRIPGLEDYCMTKQDLEQMISYISQASIYAFDDEICKGFLTLEGGHRVGLAGQTVLEGKTVRTIRPITFLNIRIAHQVRGCARHLANVLYMEEVCPNTLILSPPGAGKTTMLRDLVRMLSDGTEDRPGMKVGLVDERSEIAGCRNGIPQNDVGCRTDVLDGCPKAEGMMMLVRSMSPQILAVDEIGSREDMEAITYAVNCGCAVFATMHCQDIGGLKKKPFWQKEENRKIFQRYVFLKNRNGQRTFSVWNERLERMC